MAILTEEGGVVGVEGGIILKRAIVAVDVVELGRRLLFPGWTATYLLFTVAY